MSTNLSIHEHTPASPKTKPRPKLSSIPVPFDYNPSEDGTDENLLLLLHGLGDTHVPFGKLGRSLKLPQTATLAVRAPELIPFLYEDAYQWYPSFDALGELLQNPNPSTALDLLARILRHLTENCAWPANRIHLFGFAQGGTVAAEFGIKWWRTELERVSRMSSSDSQPESDQPRALASIVSVCGPLLSYPTALSTLCPTPVLVAHRPPPAETALPPNALAAYRKAYTTLSDTNIGRGEGMPRSKDEWQPIMRFWSEQLSRRQMEGFYEVTAGMTPS